MLNLTILLLALVMMVDPAMGCSRATRQPTGTGVVVTNPNNPPNAPPTPHPTPPPPPAAVPDGWVPGAPSTGLSQDMSRPNCEKKISWTIIQEDGESAAATKENVSEVWEYKCTFRVCTEVDMTGEKGDCACAMFATNTAGNTYGDQDYLTYETSVDYFYMVVWDKKQRKIIERIQGWDFGSQTSEEIANDLAVAAGGDMLYGDQLNAFTGSIANSTLPASLDKTPENQNNVPSACFIVTQKYTTTTLWPRTAVPVLYSDPSLWVTDCVPVYDSDIEDVTTGNGELPSSLGKRATGQRYFLKTTLSFAMAQTDLAAYAHIQAGVAHSHREIKSYYTNSLCEAKASKFSVETRFTNTLASEKVHDIMGAFAWTKTVTGRYFVGGAPRAWSQPGQFWSTGYNSATWLEPYSKHEGVGAYRKGVFSSLLLGDCEVGYDICESDKAKGYKICNKLPESWKTCEANTADCPIKSQPEVYGETAVFYPIIDGEVDCPGFVNTKCDVESTFLSFQNFGGNARNYEKMQTSWLLRGVPTQDCSYPLLPEFSSVPFRALNLNQALRKRATLGKNFATKIHYNERNNIHALTNEDNADSTDRKYNPFDTTVGKEGLEMDLGFRVALGSTENGKPAGDHPLELFPEQYAAPVSLNTNDLNEVDRVSLALAWDGRAPPCILGTQGCACRKAGTTNRPDCDAPLACQSGDAGKFCAVPKCPVGSTGCKCTAENSCSEDHLQCQEGTCVFESVCVAGTAGCAATAQGECTDGSFLERSENGLVCAFGQCTVGAPGCDCAEDQVGACGAGMCINKMCRVASIPAGSFGGKCREGDDDKCDLGFMCKSETCVPQSCEAGQSGCFCTADRACIDADAECDASDRCMKKSCVPGTAGCQCSVGACSEGFECQTSTDNPKGRCIELRCDAGAPGCPCKEDGSCTKKSFKCISLKKDGSEKKCMSTGVDCETPREDICIEYCGKGNVKICHSCSGITPVCIEDLTGLDVSDGDDSSSSTIITISAIALALIASLL